MREYTVVKKSLAIFVKEEGYCTPIMMNVLSVGTAEHLFNLVVILFIQFFVMNFFLNDVIY